MKITDGRLRLSASDVANFLACPHLTRLDLLRASGELAPPQIHDIGYQELASRGEAHEREVLGRFQAAGHQVVVIGDGPDAAAARDTIGAMLAGADVIYQGVLLQQPGRAAGPALLGRPDFLVRADLLAHPDAPAMAGQPGQPAPAPATGPRYEAVDAKLARSAKARAVVQTAFYSYLLALAQGSAPRWMHLALGNGEFARFKVADYAAYERQIRRVLTAVAAAGPGRNPPDDPYPDPVEHCAICRWSGFCARRRRSDDDLSLIAGMPKGQRRALKAAGVSTRRGFAGLDSLPTLSRVSPASLGRAQSQARLQVASGDTGRIQYELLAPERDGQGDLVPNRGLLALPEPSPGDLFFDIEGARYYSEDGSEFGLQYLFGIVDPAGTDGHGAARYHQFWAFDRAGEKRAFEELIDFITARRQRDPGLHVYHYNHYEPTSLDHLTELHETRQEAVGRLMGRFATREDEVDDLFRLGVFVDLYRVVRQGLRAGVESYSIKRLEPLCGYQRRVDLRAATLSLIEFEAGLEDGTAPADAGRQRVVAGYNEDDCRATLALRDWLEDRRRELAGRLAADLPRPAVLPEPEAREDPEVTRLRAVLVAGLPADPAARTADQRARALLADLLDWHRREAKPAWWRYFYLRTLSSDELTGEPDAIGGLAGGEVIGQVRRSQLRRFSFPPQEHRLGPGDSAFDPVTGKAWVIDDLDELRGELDLRCGQGYTGPLPSAVVTGAPVGTRVLAGQLRNLGLRVAGGGLTGTDAATALLLGLRPGCRDGPAGEPGDGALRRPGEAAPAAAARLVAGLADSYLPIQGPPGTGKTHNAADQILGLISHGRTVGITGPSHAVISHLIGQVLARAADPGAAPRIGQRADPDNPHRHPGAAVLSNARLARALADGDLDVVAGTAWLWAREEFQASVDRLVVDEAGQLPLANVLAIAGAAGSLVLLGDPQQLAQPSQGAHPPGADVSALEHVLRGRATMPSDAGLLLDQTWRMHPRLCRFTSDVFYDGKLTGIAGLERQQISGAMPLAGAGLRIIEVPHQGNTNASVEEATEVARLVSDLIGRGWCDRAGTRAAIGPAGILVVTPYNAQTRAIREALAAAGDGPAAVMVGTVDKFQGREAPVVIYSMATSSADEAPRGLEFLYDPHRLNVATSRARALAIIVASPDLVRVNCATPRQMLLVNTLCHAWEAGS